jgi:proton-dependent oligopeptide transporter, POT family
MFKNHPRGLPILFFTEMWERFGFYLMLGIFTLYMIDPKGMAFSDGKAADIYGTYLALVYLTPFLGGLLADRVLGYRLSITIGGALMGLGYIGLAIPGQAAFFISLLLIIFGNGFFKPNISTLVGNLYNNEKYKKYKDSGFNIFYMGINIGAFVCNFVAAYMRNNYGWGYAFAAAGIGMFLGLIWFWKGQKHIKHVDIITPTQPEDIPLPKLFATIFLPAIAAGVLGWFVPTLLFGRPLLGSPSTDAFLFAAIPIVMFYGSLYFRASKEDKSPIAALLAVFAAVIIFWAIFHQNGSALTIWAERYTHRSVDGAVAEFASTFGMTQDVDTVIRDVPTFDVHGVPETDANGIVLLKPGPDPYFNNIDQSKWPSPPKSWTLISTEIFQSVNPFFVVILTPLVVGFFTLMRKRNKEPSTPGKIGIGMLITALSTTVMMGAVIFSQNGLIKSSPLWLISAYGVITIGELCLSPMGLAFVSKLAPRRITGLMMGGWFLSTAIGNKLSGVLSGLWGAIEFKLYFFLINFAGAMASAVLLFFLLPWLKRVIAEHMEGN